MRAFAIVSFLFATMPIQAAQIQGHLADWNCVKDIVKNGEEKAFHRNKNCSLQRDYKRPAYGVITDDKKFYRLDQTGTNYALRLLPGSSRRDSMEVIIDGEVSGDVIKVKTMSLL
jgi:hypothetical protein